MFFSLMIFSDLAPVHYALILAHQGQTYTFRTRLCLTLLAQASTRRKLPDLCSKKRNLNR